MTITDWKALFWKEWHENLRWALLALLALALGLAYAEYRQPSFQTLHQIWSDTDLVLTIAAPLIGLALGLLQILPELRRDQWAFLVHRPVTRTTLFFGKVIPGVCLYLLATIPPLLGFALWASFPSHVPAPFDFRFTLAGWAAIFTGLSFYFAGLLVALRPARWYGSRALPILSALIAPWAALWFTEFWQAALVCILAAAVLLTAAWGSFVTAGDYGQQTKPARFALGLTLYPAVTAVGIGAVLLSVSAYQFLSGRSGTEWWRTDYKIDALGRIFEVSEHGKNLADQNQHSLAITDLADHVIDPSTWKKLNQKSLMEMSFLSVSPIAESFNQSYQHPERYVDFLAGSGTSEQFLNLYYDSHSRQIIQYTIPISGLPQLSYLGPKGSSADQRQAGAFPDGMPSESSFLGLTLLQFPHSLFWFDAVHPAVGLFQSVPTSSRILGTAKSPDDERNLASSNADRPEAFFVATENQITVFTRQNREAGPESTRRLFTTPVAFPSSNPVPLASTPGFFRFFFWYQDTRQLGADHVVTIAMDGRVLKTETLPSSGQRWASVAAKTPPLITYSPGLAFSPLTVPALLASVSVGHALHWPSAEGMWDSRGAFAMVFAASVLSGLVAALLAWRISCRCGDGRRGQIAWAFGVFWLGVYGVLLMLALRAWPARVLCPNCGRLRVVNRATCEHCGAPFARPRQDGTEIFDTPEPLALRV